MCLRRRRYFFLDANKRCVKEHSFNWSDTDLKNIFLKYQKELKTNVGSFNGKFNKKVPARNTVYTLFSLHKKKIHCGQSFFDTLILSTPVCQVRHCASEHTKISYKSVTLCPPRPDSHENVGENQSR